MMRRLWVTAWCAFILVGVGTFATWGYAALAASAAMARFGVVMAAATIVLAITVGVWADDVPPPNLPRKQRRVLAEAQARIDLDAAIAKAEREAGI